MVFAVLSMLVTAVPARASGPVEVSFKIQQDWGEGFVGEFSMTNRTESEVKDWTLEFDLASKVTSIWGADVQSHSGDRYVLVPQDWSRIIRPGQRIVVGLIGSPGNTKGPQNIVYAPVVAGAAPAGGDDAAGTRGGIEQRPVYAGSPNVRAAVGEAKVDFKIVSDWGSGFQAEVVIRNEGSAPIRNWQLAFGMAQRITGMWNAHLTSARGGRYVVDGSTLDWNRDIPAGGEVRFGFSGIPGGIAGPPADLALNESPAMAPPAPTPPPPAPAIPEATPVPAIPERFNYAEALQKSLFFYDAQRAGRLPDDFRVSWRGDTVLDDGLELGVDLSGGYFDAGDGMKFAFPMAGAMTLLAWGGIEFKDGYERSGQMEHLLEAVKQGTDWLIAAHAGPNFLFGQVGRGDLDHAFWGPPEQMTMRRPVFWIDEKNPGSDLAGEASAALTAASLLFTESDPAYAALCLDHAIRLFHFADRYRGVYSDAITDARAFYRSFSGYEDELAWAAAWLAKATKQKRYLAKAEEIYAAALRTEPWRGTHSWDDKRYGTAILLAELTGKEEYLNDLNRWLAWWTDSVDGESVQRTRGGLAWLDQWGSLRYAATTGFLAMVYADIPGAAQPKAYRDFAEQQINYILGANPRRSSYVVGFGNNPPRNPHHRGSHGSTTGDINDPVENRHTLFGALVGGPTSPDDFAWADDRTDYISNEVALDYNAGLTGALAAMVEIYGGKPLDEFPPSPPAAPGAPGGDTGP